MSQPNSGEIQALNRFGLQSARQCNEPSPNTLLLARELGEPHLIAESLIVEMAWTTIRAEFSEIQSLAAEILAIVNNKVENLEPLFVWTFFQASGIAATNRLEYSEAEVMLQRSLDIAESIGNKRAQVSGLLNMGRMYHRQGRISEAIQVLAEATAQQENAPHINALSAGHLAEMFENQGHLKEALEYRRAALGTGRRLRLRERALCYAALARVLARLEQFDEARESAAEARKCSDELAWSYINAVVDHTDAVILMRRNEIAAAKQLAQTALDTFRVNHDVHDEMACLTLLGRLALMAGRPSEALALVDQPRFDMMGPHVHGQVAQLRVDANKALHNWEQVVVHQDEIQRHEVELQRDVTMLYSLLNRHQEGQVLRDQRRQLADAGHALQAAHHEKDELLSIVAHDLNSPLTALDLTLSFLASDPNVDPRSKIQTAAETSSRVQGIVSQLSTLNDLESGSVEFDIVPTSLLPVLSRVVREFQSAAQNKQIDLDLVVDEVETEIPAVMTDQGRLQQVLANLISNSLKYSQAHTRIELRCTWLLTGPLEPAKKSFAQVSIRDEGLGLSDSDMGSLFQKYSRLSARPTAEESSSGIGLYIARSFAQSMGGDITAFSAGKGLGSTFSVTIPLAKPARSAALD